MLQHPPMYSYIPAKDATRARKFYEEKLGFKDIEREVAELKARGVTFEKYDMPSMDENGISTESGAEAAWFKDTEGNIMALIQSALNF